MKERAERIEQGGSAKPRRGARGVGTPHARRGGRELTLIFAGSGPCRKWEDIDLLRVMGRGNPPAAYQGIRELGVYNVYQDDPDLWGRRGAAGTEPTLAMLGTSRSVAPAARRE